MVAIGAASRRDRLPDGSQRPAGAGHYVSRLSFECALLTLIKHGSMIEAIKLLRQYVGLDESGNLRMGLREAKDICDGLKAEMNATRPPAW